MEFDKEMQKFVLALHKLDIKELCGVAEMLNVPIWTDPLPVPRSQSEDADGINPTNSDDIISFADRQSGVGESSTTHAATNPFVTANRSQPRDGIDIIVDMCDAYSQLPRANKRYLLKLVKRAGGR